MDSRNASFLTAHHEDLWMTGIYFTRLNNFKDLKSQVSLLPIPLITS